MSTVKGSNGSGVVARRRTELSVKDQHYRRATVDVLPDDVLLEVFDGYLGRQMDVNEWHKLVHVCRRWRQVVFASPRRLNLRLLCTSKTPAKKLLDIWPTLPIVIKQIGRRLGVRGITNIDAALEHNDRICQIGIYPASVAGPVLNSMKQPFPALTYLWLGGDEHAPVLPSSFLGGSAPRLRNLTLRAIPFPGLPKLLLSAHHLVQLFLHDIPDSGFISPEAMVTCLSSLTNLRKLVLEFRSPRSRLHQTNRRPPSLTRTVLPSLVFLQFKGVSEYLEDVVCRIDVPLLHGIFITFFNQLIFDTPVLRNFITEAFKASHRAEILFSHNYVHVTLRREGQAYNGVLDLEISCKPSDWQLSSLAQLCNSSLPPLSTLEHLKIGEHQHGPDWQDDMEDIQWLELLHPFFSAKSLYLDKKLEARVAPALQELVGERVIEVLPTLQNIFVERPVERAIAEFVTARQLVGHPVAVQHWDGKWRCGRVNY